MSDKSTAAEAIRRLAVQFQGMVEAADLLEKVGSIEQATQEATKARVAAESSRDRALETLRTAREQAEQINSDLAESVIDSQRKAALLLNSASDRANAIMLEADQRSKALIQSGQEQASAALEQISTQLSAMQSKLTDLTAEVETALRNRDAAWQATELAEKSLAAVQDKIRSLLPSEG